MLNVSLMGHDYRYEIAELIKMFTAEFRFVDGEYTCDSKNTTLKNSISIINNCLTSITKFYIGGKCKFVYEESSNLNIYKKIVDFDSGDILSEKISNLKKEDQIKIKKDCKETIKRNLYKILDKIYDSYVPWGILTGIRPVKAVHNLIDSGMTEQETKKILSEKYLISKEKIDLCMEISLKERNFIYPTDEKKVSLYVSIPFCRTRCVYCSFPSNLLDVFGSLKSVYLDRLIEEMIGVSKFLEEKNIKIQTLYIGGGTPTALDEFELDRLLNALFCNFDLSHLLEFTVEAGRPDTITKDKLKVLKQHNVSRISINPQTMNDATLAHIGRSHNSDEIKDCFYLARDLGFDNINMDVILGLDNENLEMVEHTLKEIERLSPESLTIHTLALKRASKLRDDVDNQKLELKHDIKIIKMIELSKMYARKMNLEPYYMYRQKHMIGNLENVGYAKKGFECVYNMQVMEEKQSNYAIGAGAISKFVYLDENRIERVENVKDLKQYLYRVEEMIKRKEEEIFKC